MSSYYVIFYWCALLCHLLLMCIIMSSFTGVYYYVPVLLHVLFKLATNKLHYKRPREL